MKEKNEKAFNGIVNLDYASLYPHTGDVSGLYKEWKRLERIAKIKPKLEKFLNEVPADWDVLYLGWTNNGFTPKPYKEHSSTPGQEGVLTTIGYIINKKGAKRYIEELDKNPSKTNFLANEPLDCQLTRFMRYMNIYITKEPIIIPDGSKSSIYL